MSKPKRALEILRERGLRSLLASMIHLAKLRTEPAVRVFAERVTTWNTVSFRDKWLDAAALTHTEQPVVVDGGAAIETEDSVGAFLDVFADPEVLAFEPRPAKAAELESRYRNQRVTVHPLALGDENTTIELNLSGGSSSPLDVSSSKIDVTSTIDVEQVRLDDFLDGEPDVLKLDLQGYELQALDGATDLLSRVDVVLTEINFQPLYHGSATFSDIDRRLRSHGFELFNMYDIHTWTSGELVWADAVYYRPDRP